MFSWLWCYFYGYLVGLKTITQFWKIYPCRLVHTKHCLRNDGSIPNDFSKLFSISLWTRHHHLWGFRAHRHASSYGAFGRDKWSENVRFILKGAYLWVRGISSSTGWYSHFDDTGPKLIPCRTVGVRRKPAWSRKGWERHLEKIQSLQKPRKNRHKAAKYKMKTYFAGAVPGAYFLNSFNNTQICGWLIRFDVIKECRTLVKFQELRLCFSSLLQKKTYPIPV